MLLLPSYILAMHGHARKKFKKKFIKKLQKSIYLANINKMNPRSN